MVLAFAYKMKRAEGTLMVRVKGVFLHARYTSFSVAELSGVEPRLKMNQQFFVFCFFRKYFYSITFTFSMKMSS